MLIENVADGQRQSPTAVPKSLNETLIQNILCLKLVIEPFQAAKYAQVLIKLKPDENGAFALRSQTQ